MPAPYPCPTGYICREPRDGSGCGRVFDEGPDGAWWWRCECGGIIHPRTKAEAVPSLFDAVGAEVPTEEVQG